MYNPSVRFSQLFIGMLALFLLPGVSAAQEFPSVPQAVITGPQEVGVGRTIVLDASASRVASGATVSYQWFIGDSTQSISRTVEAVYTPERPGDFVIRLVITQTLNGQRLESTSVQAITVFTRKIVLITDTSVDDEKIAVHQQSAREAGIFLQLIRPDTPTLPLAVQDSLSQLIGDQFDRLSNADALIVWTDDPVAGMQALMGAARNDTNRLQVFQNKSIVLISETSLSTLARAVRGPFTLLEPERLYLTRKEAINPLLEAPDIAAFEEVLLRRDIEVVVQDASSLSIRPWNILSWLVTYMLTHGVSSQTVTFLLMLPIIATILAFLKQVVGITTFGLYTPSIIALSFLALGWWIGIIFLTFILLASYLTRRIMRRWRLLYVPKIAIILSVVSITLILVLAMGTAIGIIVSPDTIFVLLIMSTLSESFLTLESEEGKMSALYGIIDTVLAALLCVFIVRWPMLQSLILAYPELIILTIFINILLGKYSGLRLTEYFRFRTVFQHLQE